MRGLILVGLLAVIGLEAGQSYGVQNDYQPGQDVPAPVQAAPSYYPQQVGWQPIGNIGHYPSWLHYRGWNRDGYRWPHRHHKRHHRHHHKKHHKKHHKHHHGKHHKKDRKNKDHKKPNWGRIPGRGNGRGGKPHGGKPHGGGPHGGPGPKKVAEPAAAS